MASKKKGAKGAKQVEAVAPMEHDGGVGGVATRDPDPRLVHRPHRKLSVRHRAGPGQG